MVDWLADRARVTPEKLALVFPTDGPLASWLGATLFPGSFLGAGSTSIRPLEYACWTYSQVDKEVNQVACQLAAYGVSRGSILAVLLPNCPEAVFTIHAAARLGAVLVLLNTRLTVEELTWQVEQLQARHLVYLQDTREVAQALPIEHKIDLTGYQTDQSIPQSSIPAPQSPIPDPHYPTPQVDGVSLITMNSTQAILFTSGTTGKPKGAMLSFANHFWSAWASATRLGLEVNDRWLCALPLYHVGGLAIILRSCLYGTTVVLEKKFEVDACLRDLVNSQATLVSLVPTMLTRLLEKDPEAIAFQNLRWILLGGAPASDALIQRIQALKLPVAVTYGLTEAASQVATTSLAKAPQPVEKGPGAWVGKPLPWTQVRIVSQGENDEKLRVCSPGEIGEIQVKGPVVFQGYYPGGDAVEWLSTGDLGFLDTQGDLWILQRRSDLIVTGGENVYPAEVEAILEKHPAVQAACVVGIPDPEWGQRVAAGIILHRPESMASSRELDQSSIESELIHFCRGSLAGYKIPRLFRFFDEFPMTSSGKILRQRIAEEMRQCSIPAQEKV